MTLLVEPVPDCLLFDCSQKPSLAQAKALLAMGFRGVIRPIGLHGPNPNDIDAEELAMWMSLGAGVMLYQHCFDSGWKPTATLGRTLGKVAGALAKQIGYLAGATIYDDLEGIAAGTAAQAVADFANAKLYEVAAAGYPQGEYIGYDVPLDSEQLYAMFEGETYWESLSRVPDVAHRSYAVRQFASWKLEGLGIEIDVNGAAADKLGGRPSWMRAA
jgi:glycoside hydrolase-like protein